MDDRSGAAYMRRLQKLVPPACVLTIADLELDEAPVAPRWDTERYLKEFTRILGTSLHLLCADQIVNGKTVAYLNAHGTAEGMLIVMYALRCYTAACNKMLLPVLDWGMQRKWLERDTWVYRGMSGRRAGCGDVGCNTTHDVGARFRLDEIQTGLGVPTSSFSTSILHALDICQNGHEDRMLYVLKVSAGTNALSVPLIVAKGTEPGPGGALILPGRMVVEVLSRLVVHNAFNEDTGHGHVAPLTVFWLEVHTPI
jgi:hypothetical protein